MTIYQLMGYDDGEMGSWFYETSIETKREIAGKG